MTILIILALCVLAAIFAVCFGVFKLGWLVFKNHSNKGPLIAAGICTVLVAGAITLGTWLSVRAVMAPFQGIMARVKQNPTPVYGQHVYQDNTFPFELTVYDGMDFSNWIHLGDVDFKLGIDTNAFKQQGTDKKFDNFLAAAIVRQPNITDTDALQKIPAQLQNDRRIQIFDQKPVSINGLPGYQIQGEAYSNNGKIYFWHTVVQVSPQTLYHLAAISLQNTPKIQQQALEMENSFKMLNN